MSELLNISGGTVGFTDLVAMKNIREDIRNKWLEIGLLDGLSGYAKSNIASIYEAQSSCLINEIKDYQLDEIKSEEE